MPGKRTPYLVAAALVVAGAAVGLVVGLSGGSSKKKATSTRQVTHIVTALLAPPPSDAAPQVSPVQAVFDPTQKATFYTVSVQAQAGTDVTYAWHLAPPPGDPACSKLTTLPGAANRAVWHVAGCSSTAGRITVAVTTNAWACSATASGAKSGLGPRATCKKI